MQDLPKAYLHYSRATLADSACCNVELEHDIVAIARSELYEGKVGARSMHELSQLRTIDPDEKDDDRPSSIAVTLFPKVFVLLSSHAERNTQLPEKIAPLVIFARLDQSGRLFLDEDDLQLRIPRTLLKPTASKISIGTVDAADSAYAAIKKSASLQDLLGSGMELLSKVTGQAADDWCPDGYELHQQAFCKVEGRKPAPRHIARLIDLALERQTDALPLYESLFRDAAAMPSAPLKEGVELLRLSAAHLGQMEWKHGLSPSQREALLHILNSTGPEVIAVDGPPGTGKTTLLLSVIATNWVARALADGPAPITVATSTNNQSVLNVLEAFAQAGAASGPLAGRWLPGIESFGLYMPAKSKADLGNAKDFVVHLLKGKGRKAEHDAREFETAARLEQVIAHFRERFAAACPHATCSSLADTVAALRGEVRKATDIVSASIDALIALATQLSTHAFSAADAVDLLETTERHYRQLLDAQAEITANVEQSLELRAQWARHMAEEPWWIGVLALCGWTVRRELRDESFCIHAETTFGRWLQKQLRDLRKRNDIDGAIRTLQRDLEVELEQAQQRSRLAFETFTRIQDSLNTLRSLMPGTAVTVDAMQAALDVGPRFDAFQWASHYWEGKYLLELAEQVFSKQGLQESESLGGLEQQYRRFAKIWPCFVCTLFMLPERFRAWNRQDLPLFKTIDLLIVDEAGQVPPEIAAVTFTLARQGLVVGDVHQLKPIWGISAHVDQPNALRHQVVREERDLEGFMRSGMAASCGSFMKMAQRATVFAKYPEHGGGLFLSEHRRCLNPIIAICNVMTYGKRLVPSRTKTIAKSFPTVGYVHLPGRDQVIGGSRQNETEAKAIAQWLANKKGDIEDAFRVDGKPFAKLVTVLTPFAAQASLILQHLKRTFGKGHGITVGTVFRMQGAECRVVIFSPTYGADAKWRTRLDADSSLLNVAISRARDSFLVFGNMNLFKPGSPSSGSQWPTSHLADALFANEENELDGLDPNLLRPTNELRGGALIADLQNHRAVLAEALQDARSTLTIVSPYLTSKAIEADGIELKVKSACEKGVTVRVVTDLNLNHKRQHDFQKCIELLHNAGAEVRITGMDGIHSKLLLVDRSWLVVGSFNWLSAVREHPRLFRRYESSLRYHGDQAFGMIERSLEDLKGLTQAASAIQ